MSRGRPKKREIAQALLRQGKSFREVIVLTNCTWSTVADASKANKEEDLKIKSGE